MYSKKFLHYSIIFPMQNIFAQVCEILTGLPLYNTAASNRGGI